MENHERIYIEIHTNSFSVDLLQISATSSTYYLPLLFRHSERYLVLFQAPKGIYSLVWTVRILKKTWRMFQCV